MTVVCLTVKSSFPLSQITQPHHSTKILSSLSESDSMSEERPNAHMVFFPTELYMGLIKKMAAFEIGKSAAILDSINEDLFNKGFISKEIYEKFRNAYRKKLLDIVRQKEAEVKPLTREQMEEAQKISQLNKQFSMVLEQWNLHPSIEWRLKWVKKAEEWKDKIPNAKLILDLANREVVSNE